MGKKLLKIDIMQFHKRRQTDVIFSRLPKIERQLTTGSKRKSAIKSFKQIYQKKKTSENRRLK